MKNTHNTVSDTAETFSSKHPSFIANKRQPTRKRKTSDFQYQQKGTTHRPYLLSQNLRSQPQPNIDSTKCKKYNNKNVRTCLSRTSEQTPSEFRADVILIVSCITCLSESNFLQTIFVNFHSGTQWLLSSRCWTISELGNFDSTALLWFRSLSSAHRPVCSTQEKQHVIGIS